MSWGVAIVLLTCTVRIAILPLTIKQFRSMAAMQRIQPKVKALQNKYKGKTDRESKQEMQKQLMELYSEHNVNPFASCLPLVFQMPVFIGLYQTLRNMDPTGDKSFLGIDDIFVNLHTDRRRHRGDHGRCCTACRCWARRCCSRSSRTASRRSCSPACR